MEDRDCKEVGTCEEVAGGVEIIIVDTREHFGPYAIKKFSDAGIDSEISTLPYSSGCDYLIANTRGSCGIQRKDSMAEICGTPVSDKWKSAMEELRYDILPRLISFTDNPVLLVEESHTIGEKGYLFRKEGNLWRETSMHCSSYFGFLETVRNMGVDVVCTRNTDHSIWYMISMHGYLGKHHYPKHPKVYKPEQVAMGMLCCVPGIGEKRAEKALDGHSIYDIARLGEVKGLTENQLKKIKKVLTWK